MTHATNNAKAALSGLIGLQTIMLASLMVKLPPHPPLATPLFAMGPFLAASISIAVAALVAGATSSRTGTVISIIAALLALISFGPQKWFDAAILQIWPAVLLGQICAAAIVWCAYRTLRNQHS